ncbi:hypothetical protein C8255_08880 [filamentous cyanobacterium CCP3]|nr:hypothetical protein C8255_08880 [filamentous cyanobacterium CCP3]
MTNDFVNRSTEQEGWLEVLKAAFPSSSEAFLLSHIPILSMVDNQRYATMNTVAEALSLKPNYVHLRLKNLVKAGLAHREKKISGTGPSGRVTREFFYSLINVSPSAAIAGLKARQSHKAESPEAGDVDLMAPEFRQQDQTAKVSKSTPSKEYGQKTIDLTLLPGLPEYNESWSDEIKAEWFKTYQRLLDIKSQS